MKKIVSLLLLSLSLFSAQAFASRDDEGFFYAGFSVGQPSADFGGTRVSNSGLTKAVTLGYNVAKNFAFEFSMLDLGMISIPTLATEDMKVTGRSLSAVGFLPMNDRFSLLGKIGTAMTTVNTGSTTLGGVDVSSDITYGVGGQYQIAKSIAARVDYTRYTIGGQAIGVGSTEVLSAGVLFRF